jgi:hypothetical protein
VTFRSSESVTAALQERLYATNADGTKVELNVELPKVETELSKANPGELASVINDVLDADSESPQGRAERQSMAEQQAAAIAKAKEEVLSKAPKGSGWRKLGGFTRAHAALQTTVSQKDMLADLDDTGEEAVSGNQRNLWQMVRSSGFKNKLAVAAMFTQNDDENEKAVKKAIKEVLPSIRMEEIAITTMLKGLAQLHHGEVHGLDYRFKTEHSLFRKVMARLDKMIAEAAMTGDVSVAMPSTIVKSIHDVLRYTIVFQTREYTQSVRDLMEMLKDRGFTQHRVKNYWGPGDGYQGINCVFASASGQTFELQFHTPESVSMKEEECHSSYSKFRSATDSRKMMQYWEQMVSLWDMVPVPDNVLNIPVVVQQKLEFDLSKLDDDERGAIKHRKALEAVCRYPVDDLHSRAVKAESEIGSLMVYLMNKHAPGGICEQKERRSAVRAQLSMLRQLVDTFIQNEPRGEEPGSSDKASSEEEPAAAAAPAAAASTAAAATQPEQTISRQRSRTARFNDAEFKKVGVGVKLANVGRSSSGKDLLRGRNTMTLSVDLKEEQEEELAPGAARMTQSTDSMASSVDEGPIPDEPQVRDKLRELELEFPPLKYKIVCSSEQLYTIVANRFLKDIGRDPDYEIYAVNNWWDDLEKFGAVNARFLAVRHGLRFEVTLHTEASWEAHTTHSEYMRRKFDTVIKTDVLFTDNTDVVEEARAQMRREEMWRERWARISVPDRALTIGTLRYAHMKSPSPEELQEDALQVQQTTTTPCRQENACLSIHTVQRWRRSQSLLNLGAFASLVLPPMARALTDGCDAVCVCVCVCGTVDWGVDRRPQPVPKGDEQGPCGRTAR